MPGREKDRSVIDLRALAGTDVAATADAGTGGTPIPEGTRVEATLVLRRRGDAPDPSARILDAGEFSATHGADPADVDLVRSTLTGIGVEVLSVNPAARLVRVAAPAATANRVFGTSLRREVDGEHRVRSGTLSVPAALDGVVTAVLGLDDRPQARSRTSRIADPSAVASSYTPPELGTVYDFPQGTDGTGQTIAIIELGGGFGQPDLDAYFSGLGVPTPKVTAVGVDGGSNVPGGDPDGADGEVLLDIEVAGALAPGAAIVVYFAPNTDSGFLDAVAQAAHATPTPAAISISWGQSEDGWSAQARTAFDQALADAATLGVTVTVAAGDDGSTDRATDGKSHTDFPASSPNALACGGTSLAADPATGAVTSEKVWNNGVGKGATGGGVSTAFPLPDYQRTAGVPSPAGKPGRGVPDVSAVADPATGYRVRVDGKDTVIGGTSAVSPLWAALVARLVQARGKPLGLLQPALYGTVPAGSVAPGFRDITEGTNGAYTSGPGWDACTGLGVPDGARLLAALGGAAAPAAVTGLRPVASQVVARIPVDDIDAALPLYRALGGGQVLRTSAGGVPRAQVGPFLLVQRSQSDQGGAAVPAVLVSDVHAAGAAVVAAGGTLLDGPTGTGSGARLVARHPDGAVFEYLGEG